MYGNKVKRRGFTLVELMVVIGIIVVLMGILIPTAGLVRKRAYAARTLALIQKALQRCHAYYNDFQAYPGIIDDGQLYINSNSSPPTLGVGGQPLTNVTQSMQAIPPLKWVTSSENLLLSLMGGTKITPGPSPSFQFDMNLVQTGGLQSLNPNNPKAYGAYVAYSAGEVSEGQFYDATVNDPGYGRDSVIPEFIDSFTDALPIIYIRATRRIGNYRRCCRRLAVQLLVT